MMRLLQSLMRYARSMMFILIRVCMMRQLYGMGMTLKISVEYAMKRTKWEKVSIRRRENFKMWGMSDKIGEKMKLKKSYADTDSMYIDCDRKENESFRGKIAELDDIIDNIHNRIGEIVFDELSILLNSADVEMAGIIYPQRINKDPDVTKLRISIDDGSDDGYLCFDFSYHKLVSEYMELVEDDEEKEQAIELAKQLRIIADEIERSINN